MSGAVKICEGILKSAAEAELLLSPILLFMMYLQFGFLYPCVEGLTYSRTFSRQLDEIARVF